MCDAQMRKQLADTRRLMAKAVSGLEDSRAELMHTGTIGADDAQRIILALHLLAAAQHALGAGTHVYLSTSCEHGKHGYCSSKRGSNGTDVWDKQPAKCKFCDAACICWCHARVPVQGVDPAPDGLAEVAE